MKIFIPALGDKDINFFQVQCNIYKSLGKSEVIITGLVDDVIIEGVQLSLSILKEKNRKIRKKLKRYDLHVHYTDYCFSKEGSSAMLATYSAIYSSLCGDKISNDDNILISGEIDLKGDVFEVGGIQEKFTLLDKNKFSLFIIPESNKKDIPEYMQNRSDFVGIADLDMLESMLLKMN